MYTFFQRLKSGFRGSVAIDLDKPGIKYEVHVRNPLSAFRTQYVTWAEASAHVGGEDRGVTLGLRFMGSGIYVGLVNVFPHTWGARVMSWAKRTVARVKARDARYCESWADIDWFNGHGRTTRVEFGPTARLVLWHSDMGWSDSDRAHWPWETNGWSFRADWFDFIFGEQTYESKLHSIETAKFDVDGRTYACTITFSQVRAPRRLWGYKWLWDANIKVETPPTFAGKGENDYDLDDDAIYGMSGQCGSEKQTTDAVIANYVVQYRAAVARRGPARSSVA